MSKKCPLYGSVVLYLDCLECEEKLCKKVGVKMENENTSSTNSKENCIEWLTGQNTITITLTQQKYITKVRNLKKQYPDQVKIRTNSDGSIFAKLPLSALKLSIIHRERREMSDEEKQEFVKRTKQGKQRKAKQKQDSDWD